MSGPAKALRYVTRFSCLAEACSDTCCQGMHVLLKETERDRILKQVQGHETLEKAFRQTLKHVQPPLLGYRLELAKNVHDQCQLLEGGLCRLQRALGESALPETCARFPRETVLRDDTLEVSGALACPEMARLALTTEDGLEWIDLEPDARLHVPAKRLPRDEKAAQKRQAGVDLFQTPNTSLKANLEQLFAVLEVPEATQIPSVRTLLEVVLAVLVGLRARENQRYNVFNEDVLLCWQLAVMEDFPQLGMVNGARLAERLDGVYLAKWARLQTLMGSTLTPLLKRYALNRWLQLRLENATNPSAVVFDFMLQVAVVHFLVAGHPVLNQLAAHSAEIEPEPALIERAVVQAVQWFSKYIERDHDLWDDVRQHLTRSQGIDFIPNFIRGGLQLVP